MNILHYSLGIYPNRQGGLVRYSTDLAREQSKQNVVFYLYPGKLGFFDRKTRIKHVESAGNLKLFKIENALPIPIYGGVVDINLYTHSVERELYVRFLHENRIDIIHVHSLMGLHIELLYAAREMMIPVVMTTHDFFGLCPITTLYKNGSVCEEKSINGNCYACSRGAHSYLKLAVGQTGLYKSLKNTKAIQIMRKDVLLRNKGKIKKTINNNEILPDYNKLNEYYRECFSLINHYLFNSRQTRDVYENRLGLLHGKVIPLLLPTITDRRKVRDFLSDGILHVGFMGESTEFKGYFLLKQVVESIAHEGFKIELDVYNDNIQDEGVVVQKGSYKAEQLKTIYDDLDVIVVPSKCYETFSFTAVEAIGSGMPCIVSDHVGAKDFIQNGKTGFIFQTDDDASLERILLSIVDNEELLKSINANIMKESIVLQFREHCECIENEYMSVSSRVDNCNE